MQLCIEFNADINAQDDDNGGSPLMYAIHNSHDHVVEALLQLGAGMELYEQQGYTPLMVACLSDNATACERLLQSQTILDQTDSKGRTALSMACRCGAQACCPSALARRGLACCLTSLELRLHLCQPALPCQARFAVAMPSSQACCALCNQH